MHGLGPLGVEAIGQWRSSLNAMGQLVPFGFYYLAFCTPFALNRSISSGRSRR